MFGFASSSSLTIHAFGKLPIAGDFIRFNIGAGGVGSDEAAGFASWVEAGQSLVNNLERGTSIPVDHSPGPVRKFRFLHDDGSGKRVVAGTLRKSVDTVGRRASFAFFCTLEAKRARARTAIAPRLLGPAWTELESLWGLVEESENLDGLLEQVGRTRPSAPDDGRKASAELDAAYARMPAEEHWNRLIPGADAERRILLLDTIAQAIHPFRKRRPEEMPIAFRLPIYGSPDDVDFQVAFWLDLLHSMSGGFRNSINHYVSSPVDGGPRDSLYVFFNTPDDTTFACLMTHQYESEYVNDLTTDHGHAGEVALLSGKALKLLNDPGATLRDYFKLRWF
jgi:type VI secretion system ImpM family protein